MFERNYNYFLVRACVRVCVCERERDVTAHQKLQSWNSARGYIPEPHYGLCGAVRPTILEGQGCLKFIYTNKHIYIARCKRDKSSDKIIYGFGAFDTQFPEMIGTYVGFIEQEVSHGSGMLRMVHRDNPQQVAIYTGTFKHGERHGWGKQSWVIRYTWVQFRHNYRHGIGVCHSKDKYHYAYEVNGRTV